MTDKTDLLLITGATGKTGAPTVGLLRERGFRVRAFVHTLDRPRNAAAGAGRRSYSRRSARLRRGKFRRDWGHRGSTFAVRPTLPGCSRPPRFSRKPQARPVSAQW